MQPLQTLGVAGFTRPTAPRNISRADAQAVASAYKVSVPAPPAAANAPMVERQVEQGIAAAAALIRRLRRSGQDVAVDDGKGDKARKDDSGQSAKDRKASTPGSSSGGGREVPAPAPTSGPGPSPAPSGPAPTAPVPAAAGPHAPAGGGESPRARNASAAGAASSGEHSGTGHWQEGRSARRRGQEAAQAPEAVPAVVSRAARRDRLSTAR